MQLARRKMTEKLCELTEPEAELGAGNSQLPQLKARLRKGEKSQLEKELMDLDRKEVWDCWDSSKALD